MDEDCFCTDGWVKQKEIKDMAAYTYNDLVEMLNQPYRGHDGLNYLKKMESASSIDETFKWYNSILNSQPSYEVLYWKNTYLPVLYKIINANILRIFRETKNPCEDNLIKSLINLHGDYNQTADNIIKEASINKNITNASVCAQEVLSIKKKYDDVWSKLQNNPEYSVEHQKSKIDIVPLLEKMNSFGYIHTRKEKENISYYGLNKTENTLKYIFYVLFIIGFVALLIWLEPIWPWLFVFGFMFWILGKV